MAPLSYELDTYLVALFTAELGTGNAALDDDPLQLQTVMAAVMRDVDDWEGLTPPILVIMCRDIDREPGHHGDGAIHYDKHYPVHLLGIVSGAQDTVLGLTKQLEGRIEETLRANIALGQLAGDDGERVQDHAYGSTAFQVYPRSSTVNVWWGVAASLLQVNATK